MTGSGTCVLLGASTLAQLCAGWTAVLPIGALAIYGWFRGAFLATIAGMQVLVSFLAAVAITRPMAAVVESLGVPAAQSLAVAYACVFAAVLVGIRLAVGAAVPDGAFRLAPLVDSAAGVAIGAAAGAMLGGALLVGWSMADMPAWIRLDNTHQPLDTGGRALWTFARFAAGRDTWNGLLDGDRRAVAADASGSIRASEPFADTNGNGAWDAGPDPAAAEPYLDVDRDGVFSRDLAWTDADGDGRRAAGLRECYRLADWRRTRVMHAPRIDSGGAADVVENTPVEQPVYTAGATDVDGDAVTFAIEPVVGEDGAPGPDPGVVIDPATGVVTLVETADFERVKRHEFVVVATDATGLVARQVVRLRVRDVTLEPSVKP